LLTHQYFPATLGARAKDSMEPDPRLFLDLTYIFIAAVAGGWVAHRLKLPLILGYVVGGIVISPFTPGPQLSNLHAFETLAEAGVVLLLFSIGVEFSLPDLLAVKWVAVGGGAIGVFASIALSMLVATIAGWSTTVGLVTGASISVASTMVLARVLADRGALATSHGRVMIGISLFEDLAVVLMTVVLPTIGGQHAGNRYAQVGLVIGKAAVLLVPLALVTGKVIPRILRSAKSRDDSELLLLVTIAVCLGTAAVAHALGFSAALGAFLAGFSISAAKDLHPAHELIVPLRDAFVALFFVSLGAMIQPALLPRTLGLLGVMLALIVLGKFAIWMAIVRVFGYPTTTAVQVAAGLTQIGELSFVVVQVARQSDMVGEEFLNAVLAASLISIFLNVFVVRAALAWGSARAPDG
jgi:CPA2 family monovalent cation:H+ antiporter-2